MFVVIQVTIFIDILKEFNTEDHVILLKKMGIRGNALKIISSNFSHRSMYVRLNDIKSSGYHARCGVPQGFPLCSLVFSICINDIHQAVCDLTTNVGNRGEMNKPKKSLVLFADDTNFWAAERTEAQLLGTLSDDIEKMEKWLMLNKLKVSHSKLGFDAWGRSPSYCPWLQDLTVGDSTKRRQKSVKNLGEIIDETLSFSEYVHCVSSKVPRNIVMIRKLNHHFP